MNEPSPFWTAVKNIATPEKILQQSPYKGNTTSDFFANMINNAMGLGIKPRGPAPVSRFKTVMDYQGGAHNANNMMSNFQNDGTLTQIFNSAPGNPAITNAIRGAVNDPVLRAQMMGNPNLASLLPLI